LRIAPYKLSISIGVVQRDDDGTQSMEDLMALADMVMYKNKRSKRKEDTGLRLSEATVDHPTMAVA